jgi:hypothetical protein
MKRWLAAVAVVVLGLAVWWWQRGGERPARATGATRAPVAVGGSVAAGASAGPTSTVSDDELPPPRPVQPPGPPQPPIIDEILVEKRELCEGEESLVTVRAHTPGNADDDHLHYLVGTQTGSRAVIVGSHRQTDEGAPPPRTVMVFGRDNVVTEAPLPAITVKDCQVPRRVHIHSRLMPNTADEIELHAQIIDVAAGARMKPVKARWRFGDGAIGESAGPLTSHDYGARPQDTMYSHFLVEVEIEGDGGELVRGRTSLQLMNPSFEHRHYRGIVLLRAVMTPRFPALDEHGRVAQRVRVWHDHTEPVTLTRVTRRGHRLDGSESDADRLAPGVVFGGASVIAKGRGVEAALELDTRSDPDVFSVEYVLEGVTADGLPAQGGFSLMRPPERPTKAHSQPVLDAAMRARIVRAREILKQEYVTDEDIWKLEREGAFSDLPAVGQDDGAGEPAIPPPR